ncbi:hypothetical protein J2S42_002701 [Catenuloplanes indicus]|uniref:Uncharacterized protein n=1 Tax=Catenuloplanes indicus TaxID=137267 RepID=A0AAE4AXC3_9ACTN|nr:hypothetical protein [Catenuloplanes indicus]
MAPLWSAGGNGFNRMRGEAHPWTFETRKDSGGWRIWAADLPAWCPTYLRQDLCS